MIMNQTEFCYWLLGFLDRRDGGLTTEEMLAIRRKLDQVQLPDETSKRWLRGKPLETLDPR